MFILLQACWCIECTPLHMYSHSVLYPICISSFQFNFGSISSCILPLLLTPCNFIHWLTINMLYCCCSNMTFFMCYSSTAFSCTVKTQNPFSLMPKVSLVGVTAVSKCACIRLQSDGGNCWLNHSVLFFIISHSHTYRKHSH